MKKILFVVLSLCCAATLHAQNYSTLKTASKKSVAAYNEATQHIMREDYTQAIDELEKLTVADPKFIDAWLLLAELYNTQTLFEKGAAASLEVNNLDAEYASKNYYFLAQSCWQLNQYDSCAAACEKFLSFTDISIKRKTETEQRLANSKFAAVATKHPVPFDPKPLGTNINTTWAEYLPSLTGDEQTIVFTRRTGNGLMANEDFFISNKKDSAWMPAQNLGTSINTQLNEGAQSLSPDGNSIYYTACNHPGGFGSCDIYSSQRNGNQWTTPRNIGAPVSTNAWETQPSISADERTLFFVTQKADSKGGSDLYVSFKDEHDHWSTPQNLGDSINTSADEMSPFIHPDGQTLYFASTGWPGMGKMDIFYSRKKADGTWGTPVNLGYPINSKNDDNSFVVALKGQHAYFSSDRFKGSGDMDLYQFDLYKEAQPQVVTFLKGYVTSIKSNEAVNATVELIDLVSGKVVASSSSDPVNGYYLVSLPGEKDYALNASADGYLFYSENFSLKDRTPGKSFRLDVAMKPIEVGTTVVLKNIFFETDSYKLKDESKVELDKLIDLLKTNPAIKIQISGHTDNVGADDYNLKLSESRAKSVYDYLVANGIDASRLTYKGYGETKPLASNDTEEGRGKNRRTEFSVMAK